MGAKSERSGTDAGQAKLPDVYRTVASVRERLRAERAGGHRIALVPTMGNLHAGHLALVERAREVAEVTVATIYVNPFQFAPSEDFGSYPRTFEADRAALASAGCDLIFTPSGNEIYPRGPDAVTRVEVPALGAILCGASRPTFFRGVTTVVNILLHMVEPDVAVFGEKDFQQLMIVRRMVEDLRMRVTIESVATVREADGLAMSSRNGYLDADQRTRAPVLYATLCAIRDRVRAGETDFAGIESAAQARLVEAGFVPDYVSVRRAVDLEPPTSVEEAGIVLGAATLGKARLIDNVTI